jgi:hypothetical protein
MWFPLSLPASCRGLGKQKVLSTTGNRRWYETRTSLRDKSGRSSLVVKKNLYPDSLSLRQFFLARRGSVRFYVLHDPSRLFGQAISKGFD